MKWALIHVTNDLHFWKMDQDNWSAELKYNQRAQTFRLAAGDKRLFFVERTGFLQSKFIVRTEYSQLIGEVHPGKNRRSGVATIENKRFNYLLAEHLLQLSGKEGIISLAIDTNDITTLTTAELCALIFSTLRVAGKQRVTEAQLEMA